MVVDEAGRGGEGRKRDLAFTLLEEPIVNVSENIPHSEVIHNFQLPLDNIKGPKDEHHPRRRCSLDVFKVFQFVYDGATVNRFWDCDESLLAVRQNNNNNNFTTKYFVSMEHAISTMTVILIN